MLILLIVTRALGAPLFLFIVDYDIPGHRWELDWSPDDIRHIVTRREFISRTLLLNFATQMTLILYRHAGLVPGPFDDHLCFMS